VTNTKRQTQLWIVSSLLIAASLAAVQLPTGARLDPAGRAIAVGNFPLAMAAAPDGKHVIVVLSGWKKQGLQVVDIETGAITQTIEKPATFLGIAFSPDGKSVYVSGGNDDVIYAYAWRENRLEDERTISLKEKESRYPAGLALSPDGRFLYIAENVADDIAVLDIASQRVIQRLPTEHYPYGIAVSADGRVYVSAWGGESVAMFRGGSDGRLSPLGRIVVGRHPSAILLSRDGQRLYVALASRDRVAVVETASLKRHFLDDPPPGGVREGSTPNALALSPDESPLFVAEADNNAIAVFAENKLIGRIPTDWYPAAIIAQRNRLLILSAKGGGTRPNPTGPTPERPLRDPRTTYTLSMIDGTIRVVDFSKGQLPAWSKRVAKANHWTAAVPHRMPAFKHVIYIIKENRTYDQVLGDLKDGDGDPSLLFFGRDISPNHHALAERFGIFDRFFTNAEVSSQGHVWSTAAYVTDYTEKIVPTAYDNKRADVDEGEVDEPAEGYLWNRALEKGISLRNYGEFVNAETKKASKAELAPDTSRTYPSYDMKIPDQKRADAWIDEFNEYVRTRTLPALEIMHLPNDHTAGGRAGLCTPRACMADNDLALGRIVAALSNSPYWRDTIMFVLEDDAQDGADHVDSHRSVLLVISAYNGAGVRHRFLNTTDVVATIERILKLTPMSQFDKYGRPLDDIFNDKPDLTPYAAITPAVSLDEKNPEKSPAATKSSSIDLSAPDRVNDAEFNQILWEMLKGPAPMPARPHAPIP
jgi:YVTN family beta-propeller protein